RLFLDNFKSLHNLFVFIPADVISQGKLLLQHLLLSTHSLQADRGIFIPLSTIVPTKVPILLVPFVSRLIALSPSIFLDVNFSNRKNNNGIAKEVPLTRISPPFHVSIFKTGPRSAGHRITSTIH